jgi:hypothetical protein
MSRFPSLFVFLPFFTSVITSGDIVHHGHSEYKVMKKSDIASGFNEILTFALALPVHER